ncbi:MAG: hypothetical protein HWE35_11475 [Rhodobacteraceae bacterium]|nr:hypothetical protein [Paracoccaceae bacterium]
MPDFDPLNSLIKTAKDAEKAIDELGKSAVDEIRAAMHDANKAENKSYPIAYEHMKRSIDGKGNISHGVKSKISQAILNSAELRKIAAKHKKPVKLKNETIFFVRNRDLARTLYQASLSGNLTPKGKTFEFDGTVNDVYDFRWDWVPKKKTVRGFKLRYAGNAAYLAQQMKLMKSYKITVQIKGEAKL